MANIKSLRDQSTINPFAPANVYESFRTKLEVSADPSNLGLVPCSFCVPGAASAYPAGGNDPSVSSAAWQTLQRTGTWFYSSFGHPRKHRPLGLFSATKTSPWGQDHRESMTLSSPQSHSCSLLSYSQLTPNATRDSSADRAWSWPTQLTLAPFPLLFHKFGANGGTWGF